MSVFKKKITSLQNRLTLLVCTVVLVSLSVTGYLIGNIAAENTRSSQAEKVMDIARTISHSQLVIDNLTGDGSPEEIQAFTKAVQEDTNVEYVVVLNKDHIRQSHPVAERVGQYFVGNDEDRAFQGESYTSVAEGTLGESLRAFVPILDGNQIVGVVAVGISLDNIQSIVFTSVQTSYIGIAVGLVVGVIGAIILARRVKQTLFGLEPSEIAKLLREREAMLESVREGIVAINDKEEIIVANQAAIHLFQRAGLAENPIGQQVQAFLPSSLLKEVLLHERVVYDQEQKLNGIDIVVNRVPVISNKQLVGALATFRDKSEITSLIEQLSGAKTYSETLRAQTHEFMNKLHVISAMVHTKSYEELKEYTTYLSDSYQQEGGSVFLHVNDPVIAGYLLSKLREFQKSNIHIEFRGETPLPISKKIEHMDKIITILGNLCDNAYEAVSHQENKRIRMTINYIDNQFHFSLLDNGSGLIVENDEELFKKGVSTKGTNRGYGLYLTKNALDELGGTLEVVSVKGDGAHFSVKIPYEGENV